VVKLHDVVGILLAAVCTWRIGLDVLDVLCVALAGLDVVGGASRLVDFLVSLVVIVGVSLLIGLADIWVFVWHGKNLPHQVVFRNPWV